jgi:hypothetical protein
MKYNEMLPVKWMVVLLLLAPFFVNCSASSNQSDWRLGAEKVDVWLPMLEGKKVGLLVNHTSMVKGVHLLDTMLALGVDVQRILCP